MISVFQFTNKISNMRPWQILLTTQDVNTQGCYHARDSQSTLPGDDSALQINFIGCLKKMSVIGVARLFFRPMGIGGTDTNGMINGMIVSKDAGCYYPRNPWYRTSETT